MCKNSEKDFYLVLKTLFGIEKLYSGKLNLNLWSSAKFVRLFLVLHIYVVSLKAMFLWEYIGSCVVSGFSEKIKYGE